MTDYLYAGADVSADGRFRYTLSRRWAPWIDDADISDVCHFIMLNPSTANGYQDDPTIRRCVGFAKTWGFNALVVTNLYAFRATDPDDLFLADERGDGPENDSFIFSRTVDSGLTVCAWGTRGGHRANHVKEMLRLRGLYVYALGSTKDGHPKHPLYVPSGTKVVRYDWTSKLDRVCRASPTLSMAIT